MKAFWILYMIACPNCEWQKISTHETVKDCVREQKHKERMRSAMRYWNDPVRFECAKEYL